MIYTGTEITTGRRKLPEVVAEYDAKVDALFGEIEEYHVAGDKMKAAVTIGGTWCNETFDIGKIYESKSKECLLKSAWRHVYHEYKIDRLASASDKKRFEQMFVNPPEFTVENLFEQFGDLVQNPRQTILRGLAEAFFHLDPAFKSHDKMKIGVKGLPKRVILSGVSGYGVWGGRERLNDILSALAAVSGEAAIEYAEINALLADGESLLYGLEHVPFGKKEKIKLPARGVWLKKYANGNGHLYFTPDTLRVINQGLAEYYGDVLADCPEGDVKKQTGTAVSKDLQYYPTPVSVVDRVLSDIIVKGKSVLEPSCGCGRFMDALRKVGADVFGIEYDASRVAEAKSKGHKVLRANFLETEPTGDYDFVVMNPPFYGRHYAKHVRHAMGFLKEGGQLAAVLPVTARYDHGELDDLRPRWVDLPVGSFSESGTNINTCIARIWKR